MVARLLFLMAVLCQSRGQVFYDTGFDIMSGNSVIYNVDATERLICRDGTDTYFTVGNLIRRRTSNSNSVEEIDAGGAVESLSCVCNIVAYTYRDGTDRYLVYRSFDVDDPTIHVDITSMGRTAVSIEAETRTVVLVSRTMFRVYDLNFNSQSPVQGTFSALPVAPRCVAAHQNNDDWHIFVSFDYERDVREIFYDSAGPTVSVSSRDVEGPNGIVARVACLDICGDDIYFLHEGATINNWEVRRYSLSEWISPNTGEPYSDGTEEESGSSTSPIPDNVNGLDVYLDACDLTCSDDDCDCDSNMNPNCGFCVDTEPTCQCESSSTDNCVYQDSNLENQCASFTPTIDALCAVKNPLAQRRKPTGGDAVHILGVSAADATITVDKRTARTGRWSILPQNMASSTPITGPNVWTSGFSAVIQSQSRGQRFGVFEAEIDPDEADRNTERINCIVTENSGFYNKFYTYARSVGDTVMLEASANTHVSMFIPSMQWRFQRIDQDTNMPDGNPVRMTSCDGSLSCTVPGSTRNPNTLLKTDEGIYEVYRPRRDLRSWHPIFFLYVRECGRNEYGANCDLDCSPACVHGTCDRSGTCVCYPGWSGDDCDDLCSEGFVGQDCSIECDEIFPGNGNCWDILFCQPNKMGCFCSTGFKPPDCAQPCDPGSWGPNCQESCTAPCNPRDGS